MTDTKTLAERLRDCGNDPMWADHAEVPKSWCLAAADAIDRITPPDAGVGLVLETDEEKLRVILARPTTRRAYVNKLTAGIAAEKARADEAAEQHRALLSQHLEIRKLKIAAEARCDTLAGALARSEDYVNRLKTRIAHYERALATIPAKPDTETQP